MGVNMTDKSSGVTRFRSGDWHAAVHACARAVSGGPVYVSDRPGTMDAAALAKVAARNGRVPQCLGVGLPTTGCLFANPLAVCQASGVGQILCKRVLGLGCWSEGACLRTPWQYVKPKGWDRYYASVSRDSHNLESYSVDFRRSVCCIRSPTPPWLAASWPYSTCAKPWVCNKPKPNHNTVMNEIASLNRNCCGAFCNENTDVG
jgi:hypothetical protein